MNSRKLMHRSHRATSRGYIWKSGSDVLSQAAGYDLQACQSCLRHSADNVGSFQDWWGISIDRQRFSNCSCEHGAIFYCWCLNHKCWSTGYATGSSPWTTWLRRIAQKLRSGHVVVHLSLLCKWYKSPYWSLSPKWRPSEKAWLFW